MNLSARCTVGIACLLLACLTVVSPKACAQSIHFTVSSIPNGVYNSISIVDGGVAENVYYAGEIDISVTQYNGQNLSPSVTAVTFCIELNQSINLASYTSFTVVPIASDYLFTTVSARDLTTLYYLYYQGNTSGAWNPTTAAAFQLDCWKIVQDPGNYNLTGTSGNFYVTTSGSEVSLAQTWLTAVSGTVVSSGGNSQPFALTDPTLQDLLFTQTTKNQLIPFGIEAWPGAIILGSLAFLRVQRRLRRVVESSSPHA